MQRVHHPGDRHGPGRGGQRLGQHLAAEDPLQLGVGLPRPEQPDLDLLQVEQVDQLVDGLRHGLSLSAGAPVTCMACRWATTTSPD